MKTKEIIQLVVALVVFVVAGFFIYLQANPSKDKKKNVPTVEVITPINPDYNQTALDKISDSNIARDFYTTPDLHSGLGNTQVFGPLK